VRENRTHGSEGGEVMSLPDPYRKRGHSRAPLLVVLPVLHCSSSSPCSTARHPRAGGDPVRTRRPLAPGKRPTGKSAREGRGRRSTGGQPPSPLPHHVNRGDAPRQALPLRECCAGRSCVVAADGGGPATRAGAAPGGRPPTAPSRGKGLQIRYVRRVRVTSRTLWRRRVPRTARARLRRVHIRMHTHPVRVARARTPGALARSLLRYPVSFGRCRGVDPGGWPADLPRRVYRPGGSEATTSADQLLSR